VGNLSRRITFQASLGINGRTDLKNNQRRDSSDRAQGPEFKTQSILPKKFKKKK
jgi:hypothetical protein